MKIPNQKSPSGEKRRMSFLTLPNKSITSLNFQDFSFTLDECLAVVWIDYIHGGGEYDPVMRYRLSCTERPIMALRASYWYVREFPRGPSESESDYRKRYVDFRTSYSGFYEQNQTKIEALAKALAIRKAEAINDLIFDFRTQVRIARGLTDFSRNVTFADEVG